jgi:hypothetical protein
MTIHINPEGETTVLPVSFADNLVRTGVIPDGSCIFHAILSSYSNKYIKLSKDEKHEYIKRLRGTLPDLITRDIWMNLGYGEVSRMGFTEKLVELLTHTYDYIFEKSDISQTDDEFTYLKPIFEYIDANKVISQFIANRMSLDDINTHILGQYKHDRDVYFDAINFVKYTKKYFKNKYGKNLNEQDALKFSQLISRLVEFFDIISKSAIDMAYNVCKKQLGDNQHWIGMEYIGFISEIFSVNIYFIDTKTMMPYVFGDEKMFPYKKSIILLWVDDSHFEIVGVIEENTIRRTFNADEPLIKMIHLYSTNPKKAIKKYEVNK